MVPRVVLLLPVVLVKLAICLTDAEAQAITVSEKRCADHNGTATLICRVYLGSDLSHAEDNRLQWYRRDRGRWSLIDVYNSAKYKVVNATVCESLGETASICTWFLILYLEVIQVTASDAGEYGCGTGEQDIRVAYLRVSDHTGFRLSTTEKTLMLGQNLTIQATAGCELSGTLRAVKKDSSGTSTAVPYGPRDQSTEPYIGREDGDFVIPYFRCEDAGEYEFTYTTAEGLEPIEEKWTVLIKGENCPIPVQNTTPSAGEGSGQASGEKETNGNVAVLILLVLFVVLFVVALICCLGLSVKVYTQRREIRTLERNADRGAEQPAPDHQDHEV